MFRKFLYIYRTAATASGRETESRHVRTGLRAGFHKSGLQELCWLHPRRVQFSQCGPCLVRPFPILVRYQGLAQAGFSTVWGCSRFYTRGMPTYEFRCKTCDSVFEERRSMSEADTPATCPDGHNNAVRLLSVFASVGGASAPQKSMPRATGGCGTGCGCH